MTGVLQVLLGSIINGADQNGINLFDDEQLVQETIRKYWSKIDELRVRKNVLDNINPDDFNDYQICSFLATKLIVPDVVGLAGLIAKYKNPNEINPDAFIKDYDVSDAIKDKLSFALIVSNILYLFFRSNRPFSEINDEGVISDHKYDEQSYNEAKDIAQYIVNLFNGGFSDITEMKRFNLVNLILECLLPVISEFRYADGSKFEPSPRFNASPTWCMYCGFATYTIKIDDLDDAKKEYYGKVCKFRHDGEVYFVCNECAHYHKSVKMDGPYSNHTMFHTGKLSTYKSRNLGHAVDLIMTTLVRSKI